MVKITAGKSLQPPPEERERRQVVDWMRHCDGLRDAAAEVCELVERLRMGKAWLYAHTDADPDYAEAQRLWTDLTTRLYGALRSAYARFALLRVADDAGAITLWFAEMPTAEDMGDVGIDQLLGYWQQRKEAPEWVTAQEGRLLVMGGWPPKPGLDVITAGLHDMYTPPPF